MNNPWLLSNNQGLFYNKKGLLQKRRDYGSFAVRLRLTHDEITARPKLQNKTSRETFFLKKYKYTYITT